MHDYTITTYIVYVLYMNEEFLKTPFFVPLYKKVLSLTIVECRFLLSSAFSFQNYYNSFTFVLKFL
jgi:hypothetical protein